MALLHAGWLPPVSLLASNVQRSRQNNSGGGQERGNGEGEGRGEPQQLGSNGCRRQSVKKEKARKREAAKNTAAETPEEDLFHLSDCADS